MQPGNQKIKPKKEEKKVLGEIMFKYVPYWPVFVVLMAICIFGAWFYLRITPKVYEAGASIMIKDETKGTNNTELQRELNPLENKKIIENEIEVLQSKTLISQVVRNLHLYANFYEDAEMSPRSAYLTSPVTIEAVNPDALKKAKKVEFTFSDKDSQVVIGSTRYPLNKVVSTPWGQLMFLPNKHFTENAKAPLFFTLMNVRGATGGVAGKIKPMGSKVNTVIQLKYRDEVPERCEEVLNELINVYNQSSFKEKTKLASATVDFLKTRLDMVKKDVEATENKSKVYKSSNEAVDISQQGQLYLKSTSDIDTKLGDVSVQLAILDEVGKYIQSKESGASISPSTLGLKDPELSGLLSTLSAKELEYEKLKKTTGENNPILTSIKGEIIKLKPSIIENIENQRRSLEASKLDLRASNNTFSSMLQKIPQKEQDLIEINREHAIQNNIYEDLRLKLEASELSLKSAALESESHVVDKALASPDPVSPKGSMIYMVALIFAIAMPVGFISIKGMFNNKVSFRQELENITSYPIIGEVVLDKSKDAVVIQEGKRTFIAEQFRKIRTSLAYLGVSHAGKKRVLVTSSIPGEGKSFVALNLSLSLAMTGKKVVLVELDLANPSMSTKLNVNYEQGASNYLRGECEPEEIIKRTTANNNLFFLPAGPVPDNPSELLMSERLKDLLTYLEDIFDYVIIDSAPATLLSDAYVLSPMCHATLYVVKHKFTPKAYIERLEQENSVNQLHNLGIIFNGIRSRGFTKNGYGYGYGYGYIHDNSGKKTKKKAYTKK
jgi:tyrosine-protein kinase Etk/Wzc